MGDLPPSPPRTPEQQALRDMRDVEQVQLQLQAMQRWLPEPYASQVGALVAFVGTGQAIHACRGFLRPATYRRDCD